ncbi:MAG: DUF4382 domain-containing protein [Bacteroidota bacterium]
MKNIIKVFGLIGLALIIIVSCQKNDKINNDNFGILRISITDDPFPLEFIEEANVVITKVEIREKDDHDGYGNEEDNGYPFMTLMEGDLEFNLLELRNGVTAELLEMDIPVGDYDLIRLYVGETSIVVDNEEYKVKVPSGPQTGIKIFIEPAISVTGGLTSELLLDFSLEKSFILQGNMHTPAGIKGFIFKPVIRAVNNSTAGTVEGVVTDTASVALKDAYVWIEAADTVFASAYTDTTGFYAITGIPEGTHPMFATKENYDTVMYSDVEIKAANLTVQDFILTPQEEEEDDGE